MLDTGEIGSCDNLRDFLLRADDGAMKEMVTDRQVVAGRSLWWNKVLYSAPITYYRT